MVDDELGEYVESIEFTRGDPLTRFDEGVFVLNVIAVAIDKSMIELFYLIEHEQTMYNN